MIHSMAHKKRSEWKDDFQDTGKTLTEEDLEKTDEKSQDMQESNSPQNGNAELESKAQEYLEMAQRVQAEFDNYRRRNLDLAKNSRHDGIIFAVEQLLPVLDTINSAKRQLVDENLSKALEQVYKQTLECFAKLGVSKIDAVGKPFDPHLHNAIMTEHVEGTEPDVVLDEFQEGFELDGRVIRHSVVKVSS